MDEPTTHLDVGSIDALVGALAQYEGTLIFISHDVYFIRAVAKTVLHINAGKLTPYAGDYDYYLDKSRATSARAALTSGDKLHNFQPVAAQAKLSRISRRRRDARNARATPSRKPRNAKPKRKSKRDREKKLRELEMQILTLEGRQRELTEELEKPGDLRAGGAAMELNRELQGSVKSELTTADGEWENGKFESGWSRRDKLASMMLLKAGVSQGNTHQALKFPELQARPEMAAFFFVRPRFRRIATSAGSGNADAGIGFFWLRSDSGSFLFFLAAFVVCSCDQDIERGHDEQGEDRPNRHSADQHQTD